MRSETIVNVAEWQHFCLIESHYFWNLTVVSRFHGFCEDTPSSRVKLHSSSTPSERRDE